jgi:hypothetical protein
MAKVTKKQETQVAVEPRVVYFEFPESEGEAQELSLEAWEVLSKKALDQVVASVHEIARRVIHELERLPENERPAEVDLYFGINNHPQAGAVIAFSPKRASFNARLVWYQKDRPMVSLRPTPGLIPPAPVEENEDEDDED